MVAASAEMQCIVGGVGVLKGQLLRCLLLVRLIQSTVFLLLQRE